MPCLAYPYYRVLSQFLFESVESLRGGQKKEEKLSYRDGNTVGALPQRERWETKDPGNEVSLDASLYTHMRNRTHRWPNYQQLERRKKNSNFNLGQAPRFWHREFINKLLVKIKLLPSKRRAKCHVLIFQKKFAQTFRNFGWCFNDLSTMTIKPNKQNFENTLLSHTRKFT